jgi:hypothetical protein
VSFTNREIFRALLEANGSRNVEEGMEHYDNVAEEIAQMVPEGSERMMESLKGEHGKEIAQVVLRLMVEMVLKKIPQEERLEFALRMMR